MIHPFKQWWTEGDEALQAEGRTRAKSHRKETTVGSKIGE